MAPIASDRSSRLPESSQNSLGDRREMPAAPIVMAGTAVLAALIGILIH